MIICPDCSAVRGKPLVPVFLDIESRACAICALKEISIKSAKFLGPKIIKPKKLKPPRIPKPPKLIVARPQRRRPRCLICRGCGQAKPAAGSSLCYRCRYLKRRAQRLEYGRSPRARALARANKARNKHWASVISRRISSQIRSALKKEKGNQRWERLVGYTVDELKVHLEKQFKAGMSWANMPEWDIDHIVPIADFKKRGVLYKEIKICFGLANLRPLWAQENNRKYSKREFLL